MLSFLPDALSTGALNLKVLDVLSDWESSNKGCYSDSMSLESTVWGMRTALGFLDSWIREAPGRNDNLEIY